VLCIDRILLAHCISAVGFQVTLLAS
jgi:hypothetical protein